MVLNINIRFIVISINRYSICLPYVIRAMTHRDIVKIV